MVIWLALQQPKEKLVSGGFFFDKAAALRHLPFVATTGRLSEASISVAVTALDRHFLLHICSYLLNKGSASQFVRMSNLCSFHFSNRCCAFIFSSDLILDFLWRYVFLYQLFLLSLCPSNAFSSSSVLI